MYYLGLDKPLGWKVMKRSWECVVATHKNIKATHALYFNDFHPMLLKSP
jgi:hypothetical protein